MRKVYLQPKMVKDPISGKMFPKRNEKGEIEYLDDYHGKLGLADGSMTTRIFPGLSKRQAQEALNEEQAEQNQIRRGDIRLPDKFNKQLNLPYPEVVDKFIRQGRSNGGRNRNPWSEKVAATHIRHLAWWQKELKLDKITDLIDRLAGVEDALLDLVEAGKSPKTRNDYLNSLYAFCTYAKSRKFLREHPLTDIEWLPNKPSKSNTRRDFTDEEYGKLVRDTPLYRRIAYETAASTGFRRGELASLTLKHLHVEEGVLDLHEEDDKARVERHQPIPLDLARKLYEFGKSGEALRQYERCNARYDANMVYPEKPLLFIPEHTARMLDDDMVRLGIDKLTDEGKLDFHCFRVHYINKLIEATDNIKVIQELARHSDIRITMKIYARVKKASAKATVEDAYRLIQGR